MSVFAWYHIHSLPVIPINPGRPTLELPSKKYDTIGSVTALSDPTSTGLSFLTPPTVTRKILKEAKDVGVKSVWLQPGSFDDADLKFAKENFENAVGGYEDGTVGGEGWCVLVDGEQAIKSAGKEVRRQKL